MSLSKIIEETSEWTKNLDIVLPIDITKIPRFKKWIQWNGFRHNLENDHRAYDFAAYLDTRNHCILGLPKKTYVRAIAKGIAYLGRAYDEYDTGRTGNYSYITIDHTQGIDPLHHTGLKSFYHHVIPLVSNETKVEKKQPIGILFSDPGWLIGGVVHLHFSMINAYLPGKLLEEHIDPVGIFDGLEDLTTVPQNNLNFEIDQLKKTKIKYANYIKPLFETFS